MNNTSTEPIAKTALSLLEHPWVSTAAYSSLLGVSFHQVVRYIEVDSHGWEVVFTYLGGLTLLFVGFVQATRLSIFGAVLHTCLASSSFLIALYGSILVYRAFFHRLRGFPGPFTARLSNLYQ
jgi:hypothetical protein